MSSLSVAGKKEQLLVLAVIIALNGIHFATLDYYDFSKDEYYKMALSQRPEWGYLGTMPFSVWILGLIKGVFGPSLVAIRIFPAILCVISCYIISRIIDELEGGLWAKMIAISAFLNAPLILGTFHIYSQNPLDVFFWTLATLLVVRFEKSLSPREWYILMSCLAVALLNRLTALWFGFTLLLGLIVFHPQWLRTRHFWLGGLIPLVVFAPILYWQVIHDFAHFDYIAKSSTGHLSVGRFWLNQFLIHNPLNAVVWGAALLLLLFKRKTPYGLLSLIVFGSLLIVTWLGREKAYNFYYATPVFSILYPLGALALTRYTFRQAIGQRVILSVLFISSTITSIVLFTPFSLRSYHQLTSNASISNLIETFGLQSRVPPQISNQYGWRSFNQSFNHTLGILDSLAIEQFAIWPNHYSMASSIEILNPDLRQEVISHSESYWLFRFPEDEETFLVICNSENNMLPLFDTVDLLHTHLCEECPGWRRKIHFYLARKPHGLAPYWHENLKN